MSRLLSGTTLLALLFSCACSGTFSHKLDFNPQESIRVAVLPFGQVDSNGAFTKEESNLIVDGIPLISSEVEGSPSAITRKLVYAELTRTSLDIVAPALIDLELPHRGFIHKDGSFDLKKIFVADPKIFCEKFLECDAVLYGKITKWDRKYYGIESQHEIEIELRLVAARSGKELFKAIANDSESRGLTKGPTGYSSIVIAPIQGLDSEIIEDLARRTVAKMLEPLKVKNRSELLNSPPPAIFAVSHDANGREINSARPLLVVAHASKGNKASFSIGTQIRGVPMFETSPGHYLGEYWPLAGEQFDDLPVTVMLKDTVGRSSELQVDLGPVHLHKQKP